MVNVSAVAESVSKIYLGKVFSILVYKKIS